MSNLKKRLDKLEKAVYDPIIGEYGVGYPAWCYWIKFRESDIKEEVEDNIKIESIWRKKKDIVWYRKSSRVLKDYVVKDKQKILNRTTKKEVT